MSVGANFRNYMYIHLLKMAYIPKYQNNFNAIVMATKLYIMQENRYEWYHSFARY